MLDITVINQYIDIETNTICADAAGFSRPLDQIWRPARLSLVHPNSVWRPGLSSNWHLPSQTACQPHRLYNFQCVARSSSSL